MWAFLRILKLELPCDLSIPLLDVYSQTQNPTTEIPAHPCPVRLIHDGEEAKAALMPVSGRREKENTVHIHSGLLFIFGEKNEIISIPRNG